MSSGNSEPSGVELDGVVDVDRLGEEYRLRRIFTQWMVRDPAVDEDHQANTSVVMGLAVPECAPAFADEASLRAALAKAIGSGSALTIDLPPTAPVIEGGSSLRVVLERLVGRFDPLIIDTPPAPEYYDWTTLRVMRERLAGRSDPLIIDTPPAPKGYDWS